MTISTKKSVWVVCANFNHKDGNDSKVYQWSHAASNYQLKGEMWESVKENIVHELVWSDFFCTGRENIKFSFFFFGLSWWPSNFSFPLIKGDKIKMKKN